MSFTKTNIHHEQVSTSSTTTTNTSTTSTNSTSRRFFLGGLPDIANVNLFTQKLVKLTKKTQIPIIENIIDKETGIYRGFAYINLSLTPEENAITPKNELPPSLRSINGLQWQGKRIRLEVADDTFLNKIKNGDILNNEDTKKNIETNTEKTDGLSQRNPDILRIRRRRGERTIKVSTVPEKLNGINNENVMETENLDDEIKNNGTKVDEIPTTLDLNELWGDVKHEIPTSKLSLSSSVLAATTDGTNKNVDKSITIGKKRKAGPVAAKHTEFSEIDTSYATIDLANRSGLLPRSRLTELQALATKYDPKFDIIEDSEDSDEDKIVEENEMEKEEKEISISTNAISSKAEEKNDEVKTLVKKPHRDKNRPEYLEKKKLKMEKAKAAENEAAAARKKKNDVLKPKQLNEEKLSSEPTNNVPNKVIDSNVSKEPVSSTTTVSVTPGWRTILYGNAATEGVPITATIGISSSATMNQEYKGVKLAWKDNSFRLGDMLLAQSKDIEVTSEPQHPIHTDTLKEPEGFSFNFASSTKNNVPESVPTALITNKNFLSSSNVYKSPKKIEPVLPPVSMLEAGLKFGASGVTNGRFHASKLHKIKNSLRKNQHSASLVLTKGKSTFSFGKKGYHKIHKQ